MPQSDPVPIVRPPEDAPPAPRRRPVAPQPARRIRVTGGAPTDMCEVRCIDPAAVARVRADLPTSTSVERASHRLRLLGDPTRLRLLAALACTEELCVCDLTLLVASAPGPTVSESAVSHALRSLRLAGIVAFRKLRRVAYYRLTDPTVRRMLAHLFEAQASPGLDEESFSSSA